MSKLLTDLTNLLDNVQARAEAAGVFASVTLSEQVLECRARGCESEAFYRLFEDDGKAWISFVTPDRWLSESIEADLEHTGDHLDELLEEELVEFGVDARPEYQHFRSDDRLFTFRSPIQVPPDHKTAEDLLTAYLLAYEACFRELGDVAGSSDED